MKIIMFFSIVYPGPHEKQFMSPPNRTSNDYIAGNGSF